MNNLASFTAGIRAFNITVQNACELKIKRIATRLLLDIVNGTPVETGLAKGNWHVSKSNPDFNILDRHSISGSEAISEGIAVINSFKMSESIIYIENHLKYISALEDGHSTQAPAGMVSVAISNVKGMI